jgi:hypothetical protein
MRSLRSNNGFQHYFTGNPLDRSLGALQKFDGSADPASAAEVVLVVAAGREVCVRPAPPDEESPDVLQDLQALLLGVQDPQLDLNSEQMAFNWMCDGESMGMDGRACMHQACMRACLRFVRSPCNAMSTAGTGLQAEDGNMGQEGALRRLPLYLLGRDR